MSISSFRVPLQKQRSPPLLLYCTATVSRKIGASRPGAQSSFPLDAPGSEKELDASRILAALAKAKAKAKAKQRRAQDGKPTFAHQPQPQPHPRAAAKSWIPAVYDVAQANGSGTRTDARSRQRSLLPPSPAIPACSPTSNTTSLLTNHQNHTSSLYFCSVYSSNKHIAPSVKMAAPKSRLPVILGGTALAGVGYYLYTAGGSPKVAEKQFESKTSCCLAASPC